MHRLFHRQVRGALILFIGLPLGCASENRPATVPVMGTVKWNGEPLTQGTVAFVPQDSSQPTPASGTIDSDGNFSLTTFKENDGAIPGDYNIAVYLYEGADPAAKKEGTKVLPEKYYKASTSGLTATVSREEKQVVVDLEVEGKR